MAGKHSTTSRYHGLVAGFAASAFALLAMLSTQQYEANTVTAAVNRRPAIMTNYRSTGANCIAVKNKSQRTTAASYRFCRSK